MKQSTLIKIIVISIVIAFCTGCGIEEPAERFMLEPKPYTGQLPNAYNEIVLGKTTSSQVLDRIKKSDKEYLSQSQSVIACWGQKKAGSQLWHTVAVFDEESMTVTRKYFLAIDEKPWHLGAKGQKLRFDSETLMKQDVLNEPYTAESQKRIAIIEQVQKNYRDDLAQIRKDGKPLDEGAMMINRTIEVMLYFIYQSPGLASDLSEQEGMLFDHPNFGHSRAKLAIKENKVILSIKIGRVKKKFGD